MKLENADNTLFAETVASSKSREYFSLKSWLKHAKINYRELLKFQVSWIAKLIQSNLSMVDTYVTWRKCEL